jgi:hypothetical protein
MPHTLITRACQTAGHHISTKTMADATVDEWRACLHNPAIRTTEAQLQAAVARGDLLAVQAVLQAMARAYKQALATLRQQGIA